MKIITLLSFLVLGFTQIGISQVLECDRYYITDLRDSTINSDPVIVFTMYTDTNTANTGTYTTMSFVHQNGDTLNPWPDYAHSTPVAGTPYASMEYVLYLNSGITSFPADFNGILLMEAPVCNIPYNHTIALSTPTKNIKDIDIQIFPNPTSHQVIIANTSTIKITSVQLYTATGQLLRTQSNELDTVNINELNTGIYYIKVYASNEIIATKKIIKN